MAADRTAYGARQAAFLDALRGGSQAPAGFDADDVAAAGGALLSKRARAVSEAWPAVYHGLGDEFRPVFEAFVRATPPPADGDGLIDGFAFVDGLDRSVVAELPDAARIELALRRAVLTRTTAARRRGLYVGACRLRSPLGVLIVVRLPGGAGGHFTVGPRSPRTR